MALSNLDIYVNYFRQLAVSHYLLQHNPATEAKDAAAPDKRFAKWNAEEVIGGLRTKMSFPALIIELYDTNVDASIEYDVRLKPKGAFTVLATAKAGHLPAEQEAYALAEQILYDLLQQIMKDHYEPDRNMCGTPFKEFFFDDLEIIPIGPLYENHFGYRCEFPFEFHKRYDLSAPPAAGVFDDYVVLGFDDEWLGDDAGFLGYKL